MLNASTTYTQPMRMKLPNYYRKGNNNNTPEKRNLIKHHTKKHSFYENYAK